MSNDFNQRFRDAADLENQELTSALLLLNRLQTELYNKADKTEREWDILNDVQDKLLELQDVALGQADQAINSLMATRGNSGNPAAATEAGDYNSFELDVFSDETLFPLEDLLAAPPQESQLEASTEGLQPRVQGELEPCTEGETGYAENERPTTNTGPRRR